jgi:NADPH:quinone reductase-like Zn-dependent oxidoreductase
MKAAIFAQRGGLDVLQYVQVPDPEIAPHEVLVRMRACGLNHLDIYTREGTHGVKAPLPHIGGIEPSGEIVQVGSAVQDYRIGDRVLVGAFTWDETCENCRAGHDNLCINRKIIGVNIDGGFAELVKAPANTLVRLPDTLSFVEASAIPAAFGTAWHMLVTRARIQPGEWVLVLAAGSGVGSAAVQIGKHFGCRIIATSSSDEKLQKAREMGVDCTINYREHPNFQHDVMRITGNRGVDIVFEHVGQSTWRQSIASLRPTGRLVTCGGSSGRFGETDIWSLFWKELSLLGSNGLTHGEFHDLLVLFNERKLRAIIDRTFPLSQAREAQQYLIERKQFGKVLLVNER